MPRDSAGNFTLPSGYLAVTGQTITAQQHNPPLEDIGAALTASLPRNGAAGMLAPLNLNGYRATNAATGAEDGDLVTLAQVRELIAAATVQPIPIGMLCPMTGTVVPTGYLAPNGQTVSRTTYASLWAFAQASGNLAASEGAKAAGQYGPGDGSTTFTVPNLSDYFIRSLSTGRTIGSVQTDAFKSHLHPLVDPGHEHGLTLTGTGGNSLANGQPPQFSADTALGTSATATTSSAVTGITMQAAGDTETRPKNIALPYIIKAT